MVRPNPRYGTPEDVFVDIDGYSRNLVLEQKLEDDVNQVVNEMRNTRDYEARITGAYPIPSWWEGVKEPSEYGWHLTSHQEALDYLILSQKYHQAKIKQFNYQCSNYPRDPGQCQHATQFGGTLGKINNLIPIIQSRITGFQFPQISFPEIIPQASAQEEQLMLSDQVRQIINDINNNVIQVPNWFRNNIDWVQSGHINQQEFLTAYNYLVEQQITDAPITEPTLNDSITDNMVTQQVINFNIINGRAVGSIKFVATNNFNPYYYGKNIVNLVQFKTPNGVTLLVKENRLNFTKTERDEIISYDESVSENTRITVESYVWSSATTPTPFSKTFMIDITEADLPKITTSGFMSAGIAGAIAGLVLLGFIVDHRGDK